MKQIKVKKLTRHSLKACISSVLCSIAFIANFIVVIKNGVIDSRKLNKLLSSTDGLVSFILMLKEIMIKKNRK